MRTAGTAAPVAKDRRVSGLAVAGNYLYRIRADFLFIRRGRQQTHYLLRLDHHALGEHNRKDGHQSANVSFT